MTACNRIVYRLHHILNRNIRTTSPCKLIFLMKSQKAAGLSFFFLCVGIKSKTLFDVRLQTKPQAKSAPVYRQKLCT